MGLNTSRDSFRTRRVGPDAPEVVPAVWAETERPYHRAPDTGGAVPNVEMSGTTAAQPCCARRWGTTFYPIPDDGHIAGIGLVAAITEPKHAQKAQHDLTGATLGALVAAAETRDTYCAGHQRHVAHLSATVAGSLGLDAYTLSGIRLAATLLASMKPVVGRG